MRLTATFIALAAFAVAAALAVVTASFAAGAIETRAVRLTERLLAGQGLPWAQARADGLTLTLTGTAPTEALRFRAVSLAGTVVGGDRVIDALDVMPAASNAPPAFLLELLRNDDGVSLIGLVPGDWDAAPLRAAAGRAAGDAPVADMLQTTVHPVPRHWDEAVRFGLDALALLPRSKISIRPGAVTVTAIAESVAEQRQFETALARAAPRGDAALALRIEIAAPRPVITPFTLRFVMDEAGARFDACAAVSERGRARIVAAAVAAGVSGKIDCALGLGAPSPRWAEAAEAAIAALADLGAGSVTLSDTDVTLIAAHTVTAAAFDRAVGDLDAALPDVFSLKATRLEPPQTAREAPAAQFTAVRGADGTVALRGRIADERLRAVTDAYARARFGADGVTTALRVDPEGLPPGWSIRVLAGLAALAVLH
ncbi:MAG: BON domain-containing protein, partial [Gemmobacter sp.]